MKSAIISCLILIIALASCSDQNILKQTQVEWGVIKIENAVTINSLYGSLNDVLLVATNSKILRTNDGGNTWKEVLVTPNGVGNFLKINETLIAVTNFKDYYSNNNGLTWEETNFDYEVYHPSSQLNSSKGILYHLVDHFNGELGLPSTLLQSVDNGSSWTDIFPFKRAVRTFYMDQQDRVYLGTSGYSWQNGFFTEEENLPGYIYYTLN